MSLRGTWCIYDLGLMAFRSCLAARTMRRSAASESGQTDDQVQFAAATCKHMNRSAIPACITAAILLAPSTAADDAKFRFQLPSCPTEMALLAPEIFEGAKSQESLLKAYQPFLFADTNGVFAAASQANSDVVLLIVEPNRAREVQGSVTPEQFSEVKAAMLAKNPSSAVMEANQLLQDKGTSINDYNGIVQSSTPNSATVTLVLDGSTTGADFTSLTGFKMLYADQCLVGAILIAPTGRIARRDFEEMLQRISIE